MSQAHPPDDPYQTESDHTMTDQHTPLTEHRPEPWFWECESDECPNGPEPDDTSDAWDAWSERHQWSPQDVRVCLDTPAGDACAECSQDDGEFVPWSACRLRPRVNQIDTPAAEPVVHQSATVLGGALECVERECDDYFTDDGAEIEGKTSCSHLTEMEICTGCTGPVADFPPAVPWADCPQRPAAAAVSGAADSRQP